MKKTVKLELTKDELWELMNNFSASYEHGLKENKLADQVSVKLAAAFEKFAQ